MDSFDRERMAIGNDGLTVVFGRLVESGNELHCTLSFQLITLKMAYTERVSTLDLDAPGETSKALSWKSCKAVRHSAMSDMDSAAIARL
jgi:hypothetical protein